MSRTFDSAVFASTGLLGFALVAVPVLYPMLSTSGEFFTANAAPAAAVEAMQLDTEERVEAAWKGEELRRHARTRARLDRLELVAVGRDDAGLAREVSRLRAKALCHHLEAMETEPAEPVAAPPLPRPIYPSGRELARYREQARASILMKDPWPAVAKLRNELRCSTPLRSLDPAVDSL